MKLPQLTSRGMEVLKSLSKGPVTVHQGIERHGEMGVSMESMRGIYELLVTGSAATCSGMVYSITTAARNKLEEIELETDGPAQPLAAPVEPQYRGNWLSPQLNEKSAARFGYAMGMRGVRT